LGETFVLHQLFVLQKKCKKNNRNPTKLVNNTTYRKLTQVHCIVGCICSATICILHF